MRASLQAGAAGTGGSDERDGAPREAVSFVSQSWWCVGYSLRLRPWSLSRPSCRTYAVGVLRVRRTAGVEERPGDKPMVCRIRGGSEVSEKLKPLEFVVLGSTAIPAWTMFAPLRNAPTHDPCRKCGHSYFRHAAPRWFGDTNCLGPVGMPSHFPCRCPGATWRTPA